MGIKFATGSWGFELGWDSGRHSWWSEDGATLFLIGGGGGTGVGWLDSSEFWLGVESQGWVDCTSAGGFSDWFVGRYPIGIGPGGGPWGVVGSTGGSGCTEGR